MVGPAFPQPVPRDSRDLSSLLDEGALAATHGKWKEAREVYKAALAMAQEAQDEKTLGEVHLAEGNALRFLGHMREAAAAYLRSLALFRKLDDRAHTADSLLGLGAVHWRMGDFSMAGEYLEQSRALSADLGDLIREGKVLLELGTLKLELGEPAPAIASYQKALTRLGGTDQAFDRGRIYHNIGEAYIRLGQFEGAVTALDEAVATCRQLDDRAGQGWSLCARADTKARMKDLTGAEDDLRLARELVLDSANALAVMVVTRTTGVVFALAGRRKEAEWSFADVLERCHAGGWRSEEGMTLLERGKARIAFQDYDGARADLTTARTIAEEVDGRWIRSEADRFLFEVEQHL